MSDLISKSKLLKKMKWQCKGYCKKCDYRTILASDEHCGLIDEQPTIETKEVVYGEWIPVSERLPDTYELCLVTYGKKYRVRDVAIYNVISRKWLSYGKNLENVLAWMPLPKPYKKEVE